VKRFTVLAAASLLCLGLLGCAPDDEAALTVNGEDILTTGALTDELDQMQGAPDFLVASDGRGEGGSSEQPNLRAGFVGVVLSNHVFNALLAEEMAAQEVELTEADIDAGTTLLSNSLGTPPEGVAPLTLEQVPEDYRKLLIDLYSRFVALVAAGAEDADVARERLTANPPTEEEPAAAPVQERLLVLRQEADVEVASRYGRWDAEQGNVVPPEGPVSPTTVPLVAPVG
jgi:hypothetical protein